MALEGGWKKLDINNWPEDTYIYCNKCGQKNRSDPNWVYKDSPDDLDVINIRRQCLVVEKLFFPGMPNIAQNYYLCDDCRKKAGIKLRKSKIPKIINDGVGNVGGGVDKVSNV